MSQPFSIPGIEEIWREDARLFRANRSRLYRFGYQGYNRGVSLKWVRQGEERYRVNGIWHRVKAGQFLVVNHDSEIEVDIKARDLVEGICLYVSPFELAAALGELGGSEHPSELPEQVFPAQGYPLSRWLARLDQLGPACLAPDELRLALIEQVAAHALRTRGEQLRIQAKRADTQAERYRRLLLGMQHAQAHLHQPLRVLDLAHEAGLSEFHFFRAFRQAFGLTPVQWLTRCRMQQARRLLQSGAHGAHEVAYLVGYGDPSHFGKVFRRTFGLPPGQWRKRD